MKIRQAVCDQYNAQYNNKTYRRVRCLIEMNSKSDANDRWMPEEEFTDAAMNLLIDACFERIDNHVYTGADQALRRHLEKLDYPEDVMPAIDDHLANFDPLWDVPASVRWSA